MPDSVDDTIDHCMKNYDGLLRRLADIGPLTVNRIRDEHKLCDHTAGNCPFCLLIDKIKRLEGEVEELKAII